MDGDGDGYLTCEGDCDDTDPALNADDLDNDTFSTCDGDCDDNDFLLNALDLDGDGNSVSCDNDCDDYNAWLNVNDEDGDGWRTFGLTAGQLQTTRIGRVGGRG